MRYASPFVVPVLLLGPLLAQDSEDPYAMDYGPCLMTTFD